MISTSAKGNVSFLDIVIYVLCLNEFISHTCGYEAGLLILQLYCNTQYCQYRFQYCQSIAILFENIYICIGIANTFSSIGKSNYYQYQ